MNHDRVLVDEHHLAVVPDGTIITWRRIVGDPTSEAVAFVRREVDRYDDGSPRVDVWISPGGWDPMTIEQAGVTYPAHVIRWGDVSTELLVGDEVPALVETLDRGGAYNRASALDAAARVAAGNAVNSRDWVDAEAVLIDADRYLEWLNRDPLADALNDGIKTCIELPDPESPEYQAQADAAVAAYRAWEADREGNAEGVPTALLAQGEDQEPSLGDLAERLRALKSVGVSRAALMYAVDQVWWENEQ
ncbi:hypothetical protein I5G63_gp053 [Mycobacterium phage Imvubu]|uniref:Uncharacterized protein n=1 Tax=Mycobacterium phage Imvubu TaxID=2686233 RepID=A0A6B9LIW4_9CAUD|nr:hypothetical protein I5G63_gp053 [Mycobacterium phage Imvubu]QHB37794.1 hypothetical protein PBI_IMVUBU_53 [Mycobacterium phage Imvubu]